MVQLPVYNAAGETVGTYDIDADELAPRINKQLLHDAVVMYQASQRQGSFRTKSRARVAGSTQKMFRQKGTGRARAGSSRTNVRRGGGMAFAKENRDFSYRLPKKALRTAGCADSCFVKRSVHSLRARFRLRVFMRRAALLACGG